MLSFALFMCILVIVVGALAYKAKVSRPIDEQTEQAAKQSLMAVGSIVERRAQRAGRPSQPPPVGGWYPPKKGNHRTAP